MLQKLSNLTQKFLVLEFILKVGFLLSQLAILLFYTIYVIVERTMYISKTTKTG